MNNIETNVKQPKLVAPLEEMKRMESFLVSKRYLETTGESSIVLVWFLLCCVCYTETCYLIISCSAKR